MHPKIIVMIPTYNEAENINTLLDSILFAVPSVSVLVVDDNSPDATWKMVSDREKDDKRINLLRRMEDRGRGNAGIEGFKKALSMGADYVVEMDADFSHHPKFLPGLLSCISDADIVLGSRYVEGGVDLRGGMRRFISRCAGMYIRSVLGYSVNDPTSGYRCFSKDILNRIDLDTLKANDPFVVTEVLYRCYQNGAKIKEVPIVFEDRQKGKSKLGPGILFSNLWKVIKLRMAG